MSVKSNKLIISFFEIIKKIFLGTIVLFSRDRDMAIKKWYRRPVQPDKIIKQIHDSLQSRRGMMIISITAILLLAGGVFSSLSVQGSISMIHDNTMSIDLRANVGDDLDDLIEKLRGMKKPRVHLMIDLGKKVIEINGEIEQNYFSELTRL